MIAFFVKKTISEIITSVKMTRKGSMYLSKSAFFDKYTLFYGNILSKIAKIDK